MRQVSINVCTFKELSDKAKDRARHDYQCNEGNWRFDEQFESLKLLAEYFDGKIVNYEIDVANCSHSFARFKMPDDMLVKEIRRRLKELGTYNRRTLRGDGECKLTGVCYDEDAIDGFRIAFIRGKERDLNVLMEAAFRTWLKACENEYEYDCSDEGLEEHFDANDIEFYEDGEIAR